jgi:hypothetical protein
MFQAVLDMPRPAAGSTRTAVTYDQTKNPSIGSNNFDGETVLLLPVTPQRN